MSQTANNQGIKQSWSFIAFYKEKGPQLQKAYFANPDTGEEFPSLVFTDKSGGRTLVGFSQKLGDISAKEVAAKKDDLRVVQLESDHYYLCNKPENSWEDIDLGI